MEIKPYITELYNRLKWYKYLHIKGGSGRKNREPLGGEFDFIVFYATPDEMEEKGNTCERIWCIEKEIHFGEGATIEEAYKDYLTNKPAEMHTDEVLDELLEEDEIPVSVTFKYKGFEADVMHLRSCGMFVGVVKDISDVVSFEGNTMAELIKAFKDAINDYMETLETLSRQK